MEDEVDDKIIYQTYVSHMKIMSRVAWTSVPVNFSPIAILSYIFRLLRIYVLRPETLLFAVAMFLIVLYLHSVDMWSRNLLGRMQFSLSRTSRIKDRLKLFNVGDVDQASWEMKVGPISAYAIQGRRAKMEDRFVINDNINGTNVALFAVFDGHGGEFAANYAKDKLIPSLFDKVVEIKNAITGKSSVTESKGVKSVENESSDVTVQHRKSFKKTSSTTDECTSTGYEITDKELLNKLDSLQRTITRETKPCQSDSKPSIVPVSNYFNKSGIIDYGKLLTDEVLAADKLLVEAAKKSFDVAGTTALIAILEGSKLIVANVGDSRGVMCDSKGNAIPLSFDHKPQQMRERKRIKDAGGFVTFNGVWRVAGILATSRAMGDYPLKDKRLVIADPDILTFDLKDHNPLFVILASDGLWDTFSNEEAISFIKERLHEPDYGAKSITLQSYYRGSLDNITVLIINFKENKFSYQQN